MSFIVYIEVKICKGLLLWKGYKNVKRNKKTRVDVYFFGTERWWKKLGY